MINVTEVDFADLNPADVHERTRTEPLDPWVTGKIAVYSAAVAWKSRLKSPSTKTTLNPMKIATVTKTGLDVVL